VKKIGILLFMRLFLVILAALVPTRLATAQGSEVAEVGFFNDYEVAPGDLIEVPIEIRSVTDLYAVDISLTFDPAVVTVEDGNSNRPGVQPALGTLLEAGMTLFNTVDVETGRLHFAMSQVNPSEPKSGDGILLVLYVRGVAAGETALTVTNLEMSDRFGNAIPGRSVDGQVSVSAEVPQSDATAIPVQDATQMVEVPTLEATATSLTVTQTQVDPTATNKDTPTEIGDAQASQEQNEDSSIVRYWWVVLLVFAVAGFFSYLFISRAKS
jgi:hypothetical protein